MVITAPSHRLTCAQASIGYHTFFDQVSSLLMRLSTSWYISQEFIQHFPASKELQVFLNEYLIRVVRLCQKLYLFSKRSPVLLLATTMFSSFDAEFSPLQQELDQWGTLMEKKFNTLAVKSTLDGQAAGTKLGRSLTRLVSSKSKHHLRLEKQQRLLDQLSPDQDFFESIWRRERKRGNSVWLLELEHYKEWKTGRAGKTLRVSGSLGSGKTVALANVAADLALEKKSVASFFCRPEDQRTLVARNIIGSIAQQLIHGNMERCHWDILDRQLRIPLGPSTVESILQLLPTLLPRGQDHWVVVDGLEECPVEDRLEVLETIQALRATQVIRVCWSARPASDTARDADDHLTTTHRISMNDAGRDTEMQRFIKAEVQRRNLRREQPLDAALEALIVDQLTVGAQGM